jgi:hypothetical protein
MARPCLLNNSVSLQRTQALVPVVSFHCFFISVKLLPALARSATKSCTLVIPELCWGGQRMTFSGWVYRSTAEFLVKTGLIKLALHTCSFISSLDNKLQKLKWRELQDDLHLFVFTPCTYSMSKSVSMSISVSVSVAIFMSISMSFPCKYPCPCPFQCPRQSLCS